MDCTLSTVTSLAIISGPGEQSHTAPCGQYLYRINISHIKSGDTMNCHHFRKPIIAAILMAACAARVFCAETLVVAEEDKFPLDEKTLDGLWPAQDFPPEGPLLLFSKADNGNCALRILDFKTGKVKDAGLIDTPDQFPELSKDGQSVLVHATSKSSYNGTEFTTVKIMLLNPLTGEKRFEDSATFTPNSPGYLVQQGYAAPGLLKLNKNGGEMFVETRTGRTWNWKPPEAMSESMRYESQAIAPNRALVARGSLPENAACAGNVCLFNVKTGAVTALSDSQGYDRLAFSPNGKLLAASDKSSAKIWDLRTMKVIHAEPDFGGAITFSPDGKTAALSGDSMTRFIFPGSKMKPVAVDTRCSPRVVFSPDSRLAAVESGNKVMALDLRNGKIAAEIKNEWNGEIRFTADSRIMTIGKALWDTSTWKLVAEMPDPWIGISTDGKRIATRDFNGAEKGRPLTLWQVGTMREVLSRYLENKVNKWQEKGPYEKTADYLARVNDASRGEFIKNCQKEFIDRYAKGITLHAGQTVYDPDNETFRIEFRETIPTIFLKVPANEAPAFQEAAEKGKLVFRQPRWAITPEFNFVLRSAQVHTAEFSQNDRAYDYDSGDSAEFNVVDLKLNFAKPEITSPAAAGAAPAVRETRTSVAVGEPGLDAPSFSMKQDPNRFALVIGIENYRSAPAASYAERDAAAMRAYLRALGTPDRNIYFLSGPNATKSAIVGRLEELLPKNMNGNSSLFVYYSGHGSQDEKGNGYLVPWDGELNMLASTAISLKQFYADIKALPASRIIVAMDSCFSGSGARSAMPEGARPLVVMKETASSLPGNMALLTSAAAAEISGAKDAAAHGLFTYYLLKQMAEKAKPGASLRVGDFFGGVSEAVADEAHRQNREQTPQFRGNPELPLF